VRSAHNEYKRKIGEKEEEEGVREGGPPLLARRIISLRSTWACSWKSDGRLISGTCDTRIDLFPFLLLPFFFFFFWKKKILLSLHPFLFHSLSLFHSPPLSACVCIHIRKYACALFSLSAWHHLCTCSAVRSEKPRRPSPNGMPFTGVVWKFDLPQRLWDDAGDSADS
jgi:hypothetical protein